MAETTCTASRTIGHYSLADDTGREIQFILIRDYLIAFWADHAVREFRIVDIEEI